ncbi:MAG: hypothetical protein U0992_21765 [Planctomycetaceae bacterium]
MPFAAADGVELPRSKSWERRLIRNQPEATISCVLGSISAGTGLRVLREQRFDVVATFVDQPVRATGGGGRLSGVAHRAGRRRTDRADRRAIRRMTADVRLFDHVTDVPSASPEWNSSTMRSTVSARRGSLLRPAT